MNLIIDIGNSRVKTAVFSGEEIIERWHSDTLGAGELETILTKYPDVRSSILSCTRDEMADAQEWLSKNMETHIHFDGSVPVPLKNLYSTPETLGADRMAAAVGAYTLYKGCNILLVDFGTAITIDAVSAEGEYLGGNISPGARMRFSALNNYTGRLPLLDLPAAGEKEVNLTGSDTRRAMENGVVNGIIFELEGYISRYERKFDDLTVVFTGGDAIFFAEKLKNTIFANYDLVAIGLNTILEYNEDKK